MKTVLTSVGLFGWCWAASLCPAQAFQNLDFELADTSTAFGGDPLLIATSNAIPYWSASEGSGSVDLFITYNSYYATTGGQIGLYDEEAGSWLPAPIEGLYSVFLGSGWGWPGGGAGSGDESIWQTGQVPSGSHSLWFSTSNRGLVPPYWDAPYELTVSLDGVTIPYFEVSRNSASITFAGDVSAFSGSTAELKFYLHRLDAAPDEAILLGLDSINFSPDVVPEPSTVTVFCAGLATLAVIRRRARCLSQRRASRCRQLASAGAV